MNSAQASRPERMMVDRGRAISAVIAIHNARGLPASVRLLWTAETRRLLVLLAAGLGIIPWIAFLLWIPADTASDAHAYFVAHAGNLYAGGLGTTDAYLYSPAFSQLIEPLRWLGWDGFRNVWRALEVGALAVMAGPFTGLGLFVRPIAIEVNIGNIHALLGLAVVAGFRWPATWAFVLLTKITPGIGLLWFAVRGEWKKAAIALGATAAIALVSFAIAPSDWLAWFPYVLGPQPTATSQSWITAPLGLRLVGAAALVVWGARTDRRWTVLVAAFVALPAVWETGLAMLAGLWALRKRNGSAERRDDDHAVAAGPAALSA